MSLAGLREHAGFINTDDDQGALGSPGSMISFGAFLQRPQ
jgi:hypothetical protein